MVVFTCAILSTTTPSLGSDNTTFILWQIMVPSWRKASASYGVIQRRRCALRMVGQSCGPSPHRSSASSWTRSTGAVPPCFENDAMPWWIQVRSTCARRGRHVFLYNNSSDTPSRSTIRRLPLGDWPVLLPLSRAGLEPACTQSASCIIYMYPHSSPIFPSTECLREPHWKATLILPCSVGHGFHHAKAAVGPCLHKLSICPRY